MNGETRNYINNIAEQIRKFYNISCPIDNIENVVKEIGGIVEHIDNLALDGSISKIDKDSFKIEISDTVLPVRQRFTVAHELGHLFLHMGFGSNWKVWDTIPEGKAYLRWGISEEELQANEFAAALLMPREEFIDYISDNKDIKRNMIDMQNVANHFNVSISAAINRALNLGVIVR